MLGRRRRRRDRAADGLLCERRAFFTSLQSGGWLVHGSSPGGTQSCSQITIRFVICLPVKQNLNDLNCPISAPSNDWIGFGLMQISGGRRSVPEVGRKSVPEVGRSSVSEVSVGCQRSVGVRGRSELGVRGRSVSEVGRCQRSVGVKGRSVSELGRCGRCQSRRRSAVVRLRCQRRSKVGVRSVSRVQI